MFTYKVNTNEEKKVSPLLGLKKAIVLDEIAMVKFKKSMGHAMLLINSDILDVVISHLMYVMCNRIRGYIIERPKCAPLEWSGPRFEAAQIYINHPEKLFDPLWLHTIQVQKEELETMSQEVAKLMQEQDDKGISKQEELEKEF